MSASLETTPAGPGSAVPRRGFLFFLGLAAVGAAMANLVPAVLTLSLKATELDAARATTTVSVVTGVGALASLVAFPLLGRLSDRTTGRLGRRRPFLLLGAALFAVGAVVMLVAGSTPLLTLAAVATFTGFSSVTVACTAVLADQLPPHRRGPASAVLGLSLPLGAVIGLFVAQLVAPDLALMILLPAAAAIAGTLLLFGFLTDTPISDRPPFDARELLRTFWVSPRRRPDFAWAWASRLLVFLGVAAIQAYQTFYLILVLHFRPDEVAGAVFLSTLVLTAAAVVFAPIAGKLSDRVRRRKPFVIASALIFAVGLLLAAFAGSFPAFLVAVGVVGLGQGVYLSVDIALVTQLVPDPANPAKDLGLMNIANTLPSSLVPAVAPAVLAIGATPDAPRNFAALFVFGAVAGLLGAALVLPIRKVA
ncbi:MFS transporter [Amycolatopsis sp. NPDC051371]|uniref:MFS transporter n=1 Tax=Amycolatopsis sp. NPDC051371 TaxID=3155800 RepID=UPI00344A10DF